MSYTNQYVLQQIKNDKELAQHTIINELKTCHSQLPDDVYLELYKKAISLHQRKMVKRGNFLENIVTNMLNEKNIPHKQQVSINQDGIITELDNKRKTKCYHIIDIVVGNDIEIGCNIMDYIIISCKTTCRERWNQDNWTNTLQPIKYVLITCSSDYPNSLNFRENTRRKIITCSPKVRDTRLYKLKFEDLFDELC